MADNFYASYPVEGGVTSLNGETGAVTLIAGTGISITPSGNNITIANTEAGGSVTSVGLADNTGLFVISGSPVTTSGTLTLASLQSHAANTVFAAPNGSAGSPSFRLLVPADLPNLSGLYVTQSEVGAANGVASLDSSGKVPVAQLPSAVFLYQGTWNPSTNTPTLVDGTGVSGYVYWVSVAFAGPVAGLTNPSMVNFQIGDLVLYNGSQWELTTPAAGVSSVNGAQGAVIVNAINQLTGDGTAGPASGSQSAALTLASVNTNIGSFGSSTSIPSFTVNGKGLITAASSNVVIAPAGTLSGTTLASNVVSSSLTSLGTITTGVWNGTAIGPIFGGTGQTSYATGDTLYASATNTLSKLGIGSSGQVLTVSGGIPAWAAPATSGTVTSVGLSSPGVLYSVTGSPVTTSGTLALNLISQTANTFLAAPNGSSGNPSFRSIVAADIPTLPYISTTLGSTATTGGLSVTGNTLSAAQATTSTNGWLSSTDWNTFNGKQASGNYITALTSDVTATGPGSVAATVAAIQGKTVSGTTGTTNVMFSASPTTTGTLTGAAANFSGNIGLNISSPANQLVVKSYFAGTDNTDNVMTQLDSGGTARIMTWPTGRQSWVLNTGSVEAGSIAYSTPNSLPGIVFENTTGNGRSQIVMLASTGGFNFGAQSGSGNPNPTMVITNFGTVGIGTNTSPQAFLAITAGTTSFPPLLLTSGTNTTTVANGAIEYDGTNFYFSTGSTRYYNGMLTPANHNVLVSGTGNVITTVAPSTAGFVLTSNGASADPSFKPATGGTFKAPTTQRFTSGTAATYTTPTSPAPLYIVVKMAGGGGGGGGSGTTGGSAGTGATASTFNTLTASAGGSPNGSGGIAGGAGGAVTVGSGWTDLGSAAGNGAAGSGAVNEGGQAGAPNPGFGGGAAGGGGGATGNAGGTNTGGGGSGAGGTGTNFSGAGGGSGGYVIAFIPSPASTYTYTVGAGSSGGAAGTGGTTGGAGGSGLIEVIEYYQ